VKYPSIEINTTLKMPSCWSEAKLDLYLALDVIPCMRMNDIRYRCRKASTIQEGLLP
jgi:hypothetical protein